MIRAWTFNTTGLAKERLSWCQAVARLHKTECRVWAWAFCAEDESVIHFPLNLSYRPIISVKDLPEGIEYRYSIAFDTRQMTPTTIALIDKTFLLFGKLIGTFEPCFAKWLQGKPLEIPSEDILDDLIPSHITPVRQTFESQGVN